MAALIARTVLLFWSSFDPCSAASRDGANGPPKEPGQKRRRREATKTNSFILQQDKQAREPPRRVASYDRSR